MATQRTLEVIDMYGYNVEVDTTTWGDSSIDMDANITKPIPIEQHEMFRHIAMVHIRKFENKFRFSQQLYMSGENLTDEDHIYTSMIYARVIKLFHDKMK